ncbi:MAG: ABC transporter substrate-binding protein [Betaproteobacteria bacterium]|nr:ABC transporter substrate-binding protein [Betaproteobacteria bacterium]MBI2958996.1 ABC transporter substrate-binding protein [Betaproteobacteria bacterium]
MSTRRKLCIALGLAPLWTARPAPAQTERRVQRIGYLSGVSAQSGAGWLAAFRQGMAELRWVEGRDYVIDARYAEGVAQAQADLAAKLVAMQPDLLLSVGDNGARILAQRTKTIPIVFTIGTDPVGRGVAASLVRPGGNVTGLSALARDLGAKRLQLLKEAFPRVAHVAVLFVPDAAGKIQVQEIEEAAARLKLRVSPIELRQAADIEPAIRRGAVLGANGYIITQNLLMNAQRQAFADRVLHSKFPAIFASEEHVEAGGLMSYAPSYRDNFRRAAGYVDKILKGAKPGELPIEQPVKFELVLNLKTAKAMGFTFPQSILLRADRVIE